MQIVLIKPDTNITAEKELAELIPGISFKVKNVPLTGVTLEGLSDMNAAVSSEIEALGRSTSVVSVCLVATMVHPGGHAAVESLGSADVITSAGALVRSLRNNHWFRIALIAPYSNELTSQVISYLKDQGIEVVDYINFGQTDNAEVAKISPDQVVRAANSLNYCGVQALVVSACVQMPSLEAMSRIDVGLPMLSALTATAYEIKLLEKAT